MGIGYYVHVGPYAMVTSVGKKFHAFYHEIEPQLRTFDELSHPDDPKKKVQVFMSNRKDIPGWCHDIRYEESGWIVHPTDKSIQADIEAFKDKAAEALKVLEKAFGSVEVRWGIHMFVM